MSKSSSFFCALFVFGLLTANAQLHAQGTGLVVTSSNNVGIGTTSPGAKLEVIGGSNPFGLIVEGDGVAANARIALRRANAGGVSATGNIDWIGNDNVVGARIGVNDDIGGSMAFKLGGSAQSYTRLFISSAGNVGIGTTSPGTSLDVYNVTQAATANPGNAALRVTAAQGANPKFLNIGYDPTLDGGYLQPVHSGSGGFFSNLLLNPNGGNVGIGTTSPSYKLDVAGSVHATSFVSSTQTYADFVFKPDYKLAPLSDVETAIKKDGHLPGIPSAEEAKTHGIDVTQMEVKLLQKIEELTLHQIDQEKRIDQLEKENAELRQKIK